MKKIDFAIIIVVSLISSLAISLNAPTFQEIIIFSIIRGAIVSMIIILSVKSLKQFKEKNTKKAIIFTITTLALIAIYFLVHFKLTV